MKNTIFNKKTESGLAKIVIGLLVLAVLGVGSLVLVRTLRGPSPEEVVLLMLAEMSETESLTVEGDVDFNYEDRGVGASQVGASFNFIGDIESSDIENPKTRTSINGNIAAEGVQFSFGSDFISISNTTFVKLTTIPTLLEMPLSMMGISLDEIRDRWIRFEAEEMDIETEEIDEEKIEKIKRVLTGKDFFKVNEVLREERVEGRNVYRYLVGFNQEELFETLLEISVILEEEMSDRELVDIKEFTEMISEREIELWIYKDSFHLSKLIIKESFDLEEEARVDLDLSLTFSNFNEEMNIQAPSEYVDSEELFGIPLLGIGSFLGGTSGIDDSFQDYDVPDFDMDDIPELIPEFDMDDLPDFDIDDMEGLF